MAPWRPRLRVDALDAALEAFLQTLPSPAKPERMDPIRLVCFDMDGVLTREESSWVRVHQHFGVRHGPGFEAFLRGEIDDEEFIRRDVALWLDNRPEMTIHDVHAILDGLDLVDGAGETCDRLREHGAELAIVSGGLDYAAARVARELGILQVSANGLHANPDGTLAGTGYVNTPLKDKSVAVRRIARDLGIPLGAVASVGNSSPDITMFRTTGLGIAFRPTDPHTAAHADVTAPGTDLRSILPIVIGSE
jgi:phosphoserine phosphatase